MDMLDQLNVDKMYYLDNAILCNVYGGVKISGTLINALTKAVTTILDVGRSLGSSIRRIVKRKICRVS